MLFASWNFLTIMSLVIDDEAREGERSICGVYLLQLIDPTLQGREKAVKKRKIITISSDEEGEGNDTKTM